MALIEKLSAIGDAIREKTGKEDLLTLDQMPLEIASIETGGCEDFLAQRITNTLVSYENNDIREIAINAFNSCTSLVSIKCANVKSIKSNAFVNATSLETAEFPSLTYIEYAAFRNCSKLKELIFKNPIKYPAGGWTEIFNGCSAIKKIDFKSIDTFGNNYSPFGGTKSLEALIIRNTDAICNLPQNNAFGGSAIASGTGYIYVPAALIEEYKVATNWVTFAEQFRAIEDYPEICGEVAQ